MKGVKKVSLLLALIAVLSCFPTYALSNDLTSEELLGWDPGGGGLRYLNVSDISMSLTFSGTTATCITAVTGKPGTTRITIAMTLYRKSTSGTLTQVQDWPAEGSNSRTFQMRKTATVTRGYTYRLTATVKVTRNGVTETIPVYVENYCS